jgi:quercetin dioxygenase-like cupin family protein
MASPGQILINKITGEEITWIETSEITNGEYLKLRLKVAPNGHAPVAHVHPNQDERFEIKSGTLKIWIDGKTQFLEGGKSITVKKGIPHNWWNESDSEFIDMVLIFSPALKTEIFFEQFFGLANDGKTKPDGQPTFMQIMAMTKEYEIYVASPPVFLQ